MKIKFFLVVLFLFLFGSGMQCFAVDVRVARFSDGILSGWQPKEFSELTRYDLVSVEGKMVLRAFAEHSASGLYREVKVDLDKYPYLNWSWRIENRLVVGDETVKKGDDYAARLYVVIDGGVFFWKTKALNYVWSAGSLSNKVWPNAFAGKNAMMLSLRSSSDSTSVWYTEKRNVFEDLKKLFGDEFHSIDAVAIMTDTDNSRGKATAYYGDIYFTAK